MMNVKQLKKLNDLVHCIDRYRGVYHPGQMICALVYPLLLGDEPHYVTSQPKKTGKMENTAG